MVASLPSKKNPSDLERSQTGLIDEKKRKRFMEFDGKHWLKTAGVGVLYLLKFIV